MTETLTSLPTVERGNLSRTDERKDL